MEEKLYRAIFHCPSILRSRNSSWLLPGTSAPLARILTTPVEVIRMESLFTHQLIQRNLGALDDLCEFPRIGSHGLRDRRWRCDVRLEPDPGQLFANIGFGKCFGYVRIDPIDDRLW